MAEFRYRKLGYVALNVTDLDRSVAFYRDVVGLDIMARDNGAAFLRCGPQHHDIILYQAAEPGVKRIGWELESDDDLRPRKPRQFEPVPGSLDYWGGVPETRFAAVGAVESL